jgi:hypothetical protein
MNASRRVTGLSYSTLISVRRGLLLLLSRSAFSMRVSAASITDRKANNCSRWAA